MMGRRKRVAVLAVVALAFALGSWWQFFRRDAPPGQPPLTTLDAVSVAALREDFNAAAGSARLVVLLSPT